MLELKVRVKVGKATFNGAISVEVSKSIHQLVDTCNLSLPVSAVIKDASGESSITRVADYIRKGDRVLIEAGYTGYPMQVEFDGFVRRIDASSPLKLECEDALYKLRSGNLKKSWKKVSIKSLLEEIVAPYGLTVHDGTPNIELANVLVDDQPPLQVLQHLKEHYSLTVTLLEGKVYAGLAYTNAIGMVKYNFRKNVIDTSSLKFAGDDSIAYKVKAISISSDGKRTEAESGDSGGQQRTLTFYNVTDKAQLLQLAKAELEKLQVSGYKGELKGFLIPYCEPAFTAGIADPAFTDRSGNYFISGTKVNIDSSGGRRTVKIDSKL